jgi:hypothetical protein
MGDKQKKGQVGLKDSMASSSTGEMTNGKRRENKVTDGQDLNFYGFIPIALDKWFQSSSGNFRDTCTWFVEAVRGSELRFNSKRLIAITFRRSLTTSYPLCTAPLLPCQLKLNRLATPLHLGKEP